MIETLVQQIFQVNTPSRKLKQLQTFSSSVFIKMQPDILSGRYLLEFLKPNQKQGAMTSQNVKKPENVIMTSF